MIKLFKKIISTGVVTEKLNYEHIPKRFRGKIEVSKENCRACGRCADNCPVKAVENAADSISINHVACIFCGKCIEVCQYGALQ